MFRTTVYPSSGETTVFMPHLVLVILCGWLSGRQEHMLLHTRQARWPALSFKIIWVKLVILKLKAGHLACLVCRSICSYIPDSHPHRITSTKCRMNTVVSPDDGQNVVRNMERKEINITRKIVHQVSFIYKKIQGCTVDKTYEYATEFNKQLHWLYWHVVQYAAIQE